MASPDLNTEDFSAAVDFLSTYELVDADRIGILGICGWGGLAINAAANDPRIKATVASTMYNMTRVNTNGYFDKGTVKQRYQMRVELNNQRTEDYLNGFYKRSVMNPKPSAEAPQFMKDYYDYYKTKRGYHEEPNFQLGVHEFTDIAICKRDSQCGAHRSWRESTLPLYGRGCLQIIEGRQQATLHRSWCQPLRPI